MLKSCFNGIDYVNEGNEERNLMCTILVTGECGA